ncbi:Bax inhibitor-1/YccA family protein [Uliginosibacterium sp. H3]|uniref:Bax inhibitor-1/YccA family protein n=1 Tax=Uliginosibacterium silvisoli TaxID=3114758 RepID=A0ABU6K3J9_9RHOO|nr:Bax inhibitor-1/YccA family protein [Uliginosibacterium sp. H3]
MLDLQGAEFIRHVRRKQARPLQNTFAALPKVVSIPAMEPLAMPRVLFVRHPDGAPLLMEIQMEDRMLDVGTIGVPQSQNRVLRNTYALLALSMIPTVLGALLGVQMHFALTGGMGFIVFMVGAMGFMFAIEKFKHSSAGVAILLAFTFFMGLMLSRLIQSVLGFSNGGSLIAIAAGGTGISFLGLASFASTTKRDLSNMSKFLTIGSLLLLAAIVANIFLQIPALYLTIVVVLLGISCAWLVHDINRIVQGGETNYVSATLAVYLDVYNIFQSLLALLGIFGGDRD